MSVERNNARLAVSRHAAELFLAHGVAGTSGDDIAAAAGLSTRTVWRYFRTKESCVEPLFIATGLKFASLLRAWPAELSIETYLHQALRPGEQSPRDLADDVLAARLVALLPAEPALRSAWLMASHEAETVLAGIVRARSGADVPTFDVRLCAATVMAALRVVDENISEAAIGGRRTTLAEVCDRMATAIRAASTLPICDPIAPVRA